LYALFFGPNLQATGIKQTETGSNVPARLVAGPVTNAYFHSEVAMTPLEKDGRERAFVAVVQTERPFHGNRSIVRRLSAFLDALRRAMAAWTV
jgi:hypothetical protein